MLPLNESDAGTQDGAVWGSGDYSTLSGSGAVNWEGDISTVTLGIDTRVSDELPAVSGVAVSKSEGSFDYSSNTRAKNRGKGSYETRFVSYYPYFGWMTPKGSRLWATVGYGHGEVTVAEQGEASESSNTEMKIAAFGADSGPRSVGDVLPGGETTILFKGEVSTTAISIEGNRSAIKSMKLDSGRLRLAVEGSRKRDLVSGGRLRSAVELGVREDWGDGLEGTGLEASSSLRYSDDAAGLTVEWRVRWARIEGSSEHVEELGTSMMVRLVPDAFGQGPSFELSLNRGDALSGFNRLWAQPDAARPESGDASASAKRIDAEFGYGVSAPVVQATLTPFAGVTLSNQGDARTYRLGTRLKFLRHFSFISIEGEQRERADARTDHSVMLRGGAHW